MTYVVLESCIRPSGAWARTVARFDSKAEAVTYALNHGFEGPEGGIVRSPQVSVMQRDGVDRETVFSRNIDERRTA